jgi:hypothetical protein
MRLRLFMLLASAVLAASCSLEELPTASTPIASPLPPLAPPPLPTMVPGVLSVALPIDTADVITTGFTVLPFGYHGADHAVDGHAGWDIEYRTGGTVRAAAAGEVLSVDVDAGTGRSTITLQHVVGEHFYRTIYTNVTAVRSGVSADAAVVPGQPLGTAGSAAAVGGFPSGNAVIHFQLDDLEFHREGPSPKAVSPEPFLSEPARLLFAQLWGTAAYAHELVEPFITNPRSLSFPASRTWTRAGGDGPAGIRFTRRDGRSADYEYALLAESGTTVEAGSVLLDPTARPFATIDLVSPTHRRLGIYDVVSNEMRFTLSSPGAARPTTLDATHVYRTPR